MSIKNFLSFGDSETVFAEVVSELSKRAKIFRGTWSQWNSLTTDQKKKFDKASIPNLTTSTQSYPSNLVSFDNEGSGLSSHNVEAAIKELETNFQDGVDDIYNAVVAKGSTPASHSLSDVIDGIGNILTPSGTLAITANSNSVNVSQYATVSVNVPNSNSDTFTANSRASAIDMGATNNYRYVDTRNVPNTNSTTYDATTRSSKIDLGADNTYRYLKTNSVPNSNSATYTTTTRENKDLGAANTYRYVNTSNMPNVNSTTYTATTRSDKIDLGAANTYRYLVTSGVPNSNSTTYKYGSNSTGGTVNMGASNTYRYVNAEKVYSKGKSDGLATKKTYKIVLGVNNSLYYTAEVKIYDSSGTLLVSHKRGDGNATDTGEFTDTF